MFAALELSDYGLLGIVASALAVVFRLLMAAKDAQIADLLLQRDNYKEMAREATHNLEAVAERGGRKPKVVPLAPVIPEQHSPPTLEQKEAAELATLRAKLVAATLALELPARTTSNGGKTEPKEKS